MLAIRCQWQGGRARARARGRGCPRSDVGLGRGEQGVYSEVQGIRNRHMGPPMDRQKDRHTR